MVTPPPDTSHTTTPSCWVPWVMKRVTLTTQCESGTWRTYHSKTVSLSFSSLYGQFLFCVVQHEIQSLGLQKMKVLLTSTPSSCLDLEHSAIPQLMHKNSMIMSAHLWCDRDVSYEEVANIYCNTHFPIVKL